MENQEILDMLKKASSVCMVWYGRHVEHAALCKHTCGPHKGYCNLVI